MPEGPEVFLIVQQLRKHLKPDDYPKIFCVGKNIFINRKSGDYIYNHLGMTGWWTFNNSSEPERHETAQLPTTSGFAHFIDPRKLGEFKIMNVREVENKLEQLGPDINGISLEALNKALGARPRSVLGTVIMDQSTISGVGNYLRAEILYTARLDPRRKVASLNAGDYEKLHKAINKVFHEVVEAGGESKYTGFGDAGDADTGGSYKPKVYGRTKDKNGREVRADKMGGRTLYWVPEVQK